MPINNYGFDPFQTEELLLQEKEKRALLDYLRTPKRGQVVAGVLVGGQGPGDEFADTVQRGRAKMELDQLPEQRRNLSDQYQRSMIEALRSGTPESLAAHPATRQQGLDLVKKRADLEMSNKGLQDLLGGLQGGGQPQSAGGDDLYSKATMMAMSPDPRIAAIGKQLLDQMKGQDPKNSMRVNPLTGQGSAIPGAAKLYAQNQAADEDARAALDMIDVPLGDGTGRTRKMSRLDYARSQGYGASPQSPQTPQPGAVGVGPTPGPAPGVSALPKSAAAGSVQPAPGASGGSGHPNQDMIDAFQTAIRTGDMRAASYWGSELAKLGIKVDASMPMTEQQRRSMAATGDPKQVPRSVLPNATGQAPTMSVQDFGVADPRRAEAQKHMIAGDAKRLEALETKVDKGVEAEAALSRMQQANNSGKLIWGPGNEVMTYAKRGAAWLMNKPAPEEVYLTEQYVKDIQTQLKGQLAAFGSGTGISNLDLLTAQKSLPELGLTQEGRARIISAAMADIRSAQRNAAEAREVFMRQGHLTGWQPKVYNERGEVIYTGRPGQSNPTEPGQPTAAPGQKPAPQPNTEGMGAASPLQNLAQSVGDSMKSLVNPMNIPSKLAGARDAWGNEVVGAAQLAGLYSGDEWKQRKAEQEKRMGRDEGYRTGHAFGSTASPTSLIGGGGILKATLGGLVSGLIQPQENEWDKVNSGLLSATISALSHGASKVFPSTQVMPEGKWYDITGSTKGNAAAAADRAGFKDVPLTSSQINPADPYSMVARVLGTNELAAGDQAKAITRELLKRGGSDATDVSRKVIDDQLGVLGKEYDKLFPRNIKAKVDTTAAQGFIDAMGQDPQLMKATSTTADLGKIFSVLSGGGGPKLIPFDVLQRGYLQLKHDVPYSQASQKARDFLEDVIRKGLGPDKSAHWDKLTKQYGAMKDVEMLFKEGMSVGEYGGSVLPSKVVYSKRHALPGSAAEEAAQFIERYGIRDPKYINDLGLGDFLNLTNIMQGVPGLRQIPKGLNALDSSKGLDLSPDKRILLEMLRVGTARTPRELSEYGRQ